MESTCDSSIVTEVNAPCIGQSIQEQLDPSRLPFLYPLDLLARRTGDNTRIIAADRGADSIPHASCDEQDIHWWLLHTRSRQEKKVAEQLAAQDVPHFLPVVQRKSLSRGRARSAEIPLFPSYLFLCGTEEDRIRALQTNRICAIEKVSDGEQLKADLLRIAKLISLDAPLTPEASLVAGQRVRVKSGLFAGYEGTVLKRCGKTRLFIAVKYMQMGASMEIQDYLLDPI
jgi:transcription antitermination factor NusG